MAPKLRVYNLARELNLDNAEIIRELQHMGVPVTSHSNTVDDRQAVHVRRGAGLLRFDGPGAAGQGVGRDRVLRDGQGRAAGQGGV